MKENNTDNKFKLDEDGYRALRYMLAALAEKTIWKHNTLCEGEEDVFIDAIANLFVQEQGDRVLLFIISHLEEIYSRFTQRYQLIVKENNNPFATTVLSYLNIEECLEVASNYPKVYDGNFDFTIVDTDLKNRKVLDNDAVRELMKKEKHYFWLASSDDGSFENFSATTFTDKEMCYNDMRNSALDKMKWNTEYREDFADMDDDEFIGYKVKFRKDMIITHESYSGLYTYQIFCVEELKARPELFFGSQFCKDLHYDKYAGEICDALMKINKRYLAD